MLLRNIQKMALNQKLGKDFSKIIYNDSKQERP